MAKNKDKAVVVIVSDITDRQASELLAACSRAKFRIAPNGRGSAAVTRRDTIGNLLQNTWAQLTDAHH